MLHHKPTLAIPQAIVERTRILNVFEASIPRTLEAATLLGLIKLMIRGRTVEHDRCQNAQAAQTKCVQTALSWRICHIFVGIICAIDLLASLIGATTATIRLEVVHEPTGALVDERIAAGIAAEIILRTVDGVCEKVCPILVIIESSLKKSIRFIFTYWDSIQLPCIEAQRHSLIPHQRTKCRRYSHTAAAPDRYSRNSAPKPDSRIRHRSGDEIVHECNV